MRERKPRRVTTARNNVALHKHLLGCKHVRGLDTGSARRALHRGRAAVGRRGPARAHRARARASCSPRSRSKEPATLNQVAKAVGRGAPAVSRSVDALVRAGLVERTQDPDNRRRLALRLTEAGRERAAAAQRRRRRRSRNKLERLAHSELRAIERAIEILERARPSRCRAAAGLPALLGGGAAARERPRLVLAALVLLVDRPPRALSASFLETPRFS